MNKVEVKRENGETIVIELLLSFEAREIGKKYIAYTLNDDGVSDFETVLISEIDDDMNIKDVLPEDAPFANAAYEELKQMIAAV